MLACLIVASLSQLRRKKSSALTFCKEAKSPGRRWGACSPTRGLGPAPRHALSLGEGAGFRKSGCWCCLGTPWWLACHLLNPRFYPPHPGETRGASKKPSYAIHREGLHSNGREKLKKNTAATPRVLRIHGPSVLVRTEKGVNLPCNNALDLRAEDAPAWFAPATAAPVVFLLEASEAFRLALKAFEAQAAVRNKASSRYWLLKGS